MKKRQRVSLKNEINNYKYFFINFQVLSCRLNGGQETIRS